MSAKVIMTALVAVLVAMYAVADLLSPEAAALLGVPAAGAIAVGLALGRRRGR